VHKTQARKYVAEVHMHLRVFMLYMYTLYSMTVHGSLTSVTVQVLTVLRYIAQDIRRSTTWRCGFLVVSNEEQE
jgi:hypothetical protein